MRFKILAATAALIVNICTADAAIINYNITGSIKATFSVDTSAGRCSTTSISFTYCNVNATVNGSAFNNANVTFGAGDFSGLSLYTAGTFRPVYDFTGTELFTGTVADPTLKLGSFTLPATNLSSGGVPINSAPSGLYVLSATIAAVPEPATWALMFVGFGMAGTALRRRKRIAVAVA